MTPLPAEDVRDKQIGLLATDTTRTKLLAKVRAAAEREGVAATGLARDILLADYQGAVRRKTARRANTHPRPGRRYEQNRIVIPVSAGEHAHIAACAADNGTTITDWAWGEIALAMKPKRPNRKRQEGHQQ